MHFHNIKQRITSASKFNNLQIPISKLYEEEYDEDMEEVMKKPLNILKSISSVVSTSEHHHISEKDIKDIDFTEQVYL
jgi:hypothetical protein